MNAPYYSDDLVTLYHGDCIEVMRNLPDNSVHAVVTDPPYGIRFMGSAWDGADIVARQQRGKITSPMPAGVGGPNGGYRSVAAEAGRYNPGENVAFQEWCREWSAECFRILTPGGHLLASGSPRTSHRLISGIEDAGFEIRDSIAWLFGSGFPKGVNLTDEFEGWGTALKPAFELIAVGRKPLGQTVAANMAQHGTGAIHIAATRVGDEVLEPITRGTSRIGTFEGIEGKVTAERIGRWPTNVLLDKSQAVFLDSQTGILTSGANPTKRGSDKFRNAYGDFKGQVEIEPNRGADSGGASRFFPTFHYEAKAPGTERPDVDGVRHPTVKPLELMRWLVRLVASPGATILEPFAGSGTTLEAALIEGFNVIGIEREETYLPLIMQRITKPLQQSLFGDLA